MKNLRQNNQIIYVFNSIHHYCKYKSGYTFITACDFDTPLIKQNRTDEKCMFSSGCSY